VILLLNGAFGIGKTTVARLLVRRMRRAVLFNPELIGSALQLVNRVYDFQDLPSWRRLTIAGLRATRLFWPNVIVPMAFSNPAYLEEIRRRIERFEPDVVHVCLVAPVDVVHARLRRRGDTDEWPYRRASECCLAHERNEFARQVDAARDAEVIAGELLTA
jgi:AAA domain